jgi:DNA-directed RNA polymerase specialized sigma24 family protein
MQIRDFTQTEADYLEAVCNFTPEENILFQLRLKDITLEDCAERMNRSVDSVKQLSRRVNAKISREL